MDRTSIRRSSLGMYALLLGAGAVGSLASSPLMAGCGTSGETGAPPAQRAAPAERPGGGFGFISTVYHPAPASIPVGLSSGKSYESSPVPGIVGLWNVKFTSDGTASPFSIPFGAEVDSATVQWHSDGTEIMVSGSRPPSTGDVCMGVWKQTGPYTYKLKHIALGWASSDAPGGPVSPAPAVFLGPAIIREQVWLSLSRNSYEGMFTIDQYKTDETTLIEHIGGTISATRVTVD